MSILKSTFILNSVLVILSADITPPIEPNGLGISKGILTFSVISNICWKLFILTYTTIPLIKPLIVTWYFMSLKLPWSLNSIFEFTASSDKFVLKNDAYLYLLS